MIRLIGEDLKNNLEKIESELHMTLNDDEKGLLLFLNECMEYVMKEKPNDDYAYNEIYSVYTNWCQDKEIKSIIDKEEFSNWFDYNEISESDVNSNKMYKYLVLTEKAKKMYLKEDGFKLWLDTKIKELKKSKIINNKGKKDEEVTIYLKVDGYDMDYNHAGEELLHIFAYCNNKGYEMRDVICDFIPYARSNADYKCHEYERLLWLIDDACTNRIVTTNIQSLTSDHIFFKKFVESLEETECSLELIYDNIQI